MADGMGQGTDALAQGVANQIAQNLGLIVKALQSGALNTATTTSSAGGSSGLYLPINIGGTVYKIALLNAS